MRARVSLSPVAEDDLADLHAWLNDREAFGAYDEAPSSPLEVVRSRFASGAYRGDTRATWIIRVGSERVGYCNFAVHPWDDWVAVIGVIIAVPRFRGQGHGTEAHRLLVSRILEEYPGIEKVEAITDVRNDPERRVLEKNGFQMEGILRWRNRLYGELRDMCVYGKLRPEWEKEHGAVRRSS